MVKKSNNDQPKKMKFEIAKLNYIDLKAPEEYQEAQSGQKMYDILNTKSDQTSFIINGKEIEQDHIGILCKQVENSYNNSDVKDYRPLLAEALKKMFMYAEAEIPSEPILQELVINCFSYQAFFDTKVFFNSNLTPADPQKNTIYINCNDNSNVELKVNGEHGVIFTDEKDGWKDKSKSIPISSSLEFKLKSNNNEVEYTGGKVSLTLTPKSAGVEQDRNLFSKLVKAVKDLLQKAFGKENVKEVKHEFKFYEPNSTINSPEVKSIDNRSQNIIK